MRLREICLVSAPVVLSTIAIAIANIVLQFSLPPTLGWIVFRTVLAAVCLILISIVGIAVWKEIAAGRRGEESSDAPLNRRDR